jgi:hypothetical protein
MKRTIKTSLTKSALSIFILLTLFYTSCEKADTSILIEEPAPVVPVVVTVDSSAVFTIPSGETPCTLPEEYPLFQLNIPLKSASTMALNVQVSKKGKWSVSTDTVEGIYFAGKGTFSDTGIVNITLVGSGTPSRVGTFNLRAKINNQARLLTVAVIDSNVVVEPVPVNAYFTGKLGTTDIVINAKPFYAPLMTATHDRVRYQAEIANSDIPTMGSLTIFKGVMSNHKSSTEADFKSFFKPGAYPLLLPPCQDTYKTNGVGLYYFDRLTNDSWLSVYSDSDQSGSSFKIVGVEDGYSGGNYFVRIKAKIDCEMRHIGSGAFKRLSGELVGHYVRQQPN